MMLDEKLIDLQSDKIHPEGNTNAYTKFNGNPSNICQNVSVWVGDPGPIWDEGGLGPGLPTLDLGQSDGPTNTAIPRAMTIAWLKKIHMKTHFTS